MSKDKRKIPKRRFPEFSGEWEITTLGKTVEIIMGQSPKGINYTTNPNNHILVQGNADLVNQRVVPRVWTTQITKLAKAGDLIISVRAPVGEIGKTDYDVVLGRGVAAIKGNEFIYQLLGKLNIENFWSKQSTGSTFQSITSDILREAEIPIPTYAEQVRIGNFFRQLDDLITKQQQKIEKMQATKSAYLTQMFPAEGEKQPRLRFPEFSGDWEEKKLGDISISYSGGTPTVGIPEYYAGNIPFIRSSEIHTNSTELFISEEGLNNSSAKLVEPGIILYALYGATSGEVNISKLYGAINQAILAIKLFPLFDAYFLVKWLQSNRDNITALYLQGGQGNLSGTIVKNIIIPIPTYAEQVRIGDFFRQLDDVIAANQRKLNKLKALKEAYLNEMFV